MNYRRREERRFYLPYKPKLYSLYIWW